MVPEHRETGDCSEAVEPEMFNASSCVCFLCTTNSSQVLYLYAACLPSNKTDQNHAAILDFGCHDNEGIERTADALQYQGIGMGAPVAVAVLHSVQSPSVVCSLDER